MEKLLEVENVHSYYGHIHALKGISLYVEEGEIVSLIGSNGAGWQHCAICVSKRPTPRIRTSSFPDPTLLGLRAMGG